MTAAARGVVGLIPARLGSTRFPEKVLADATGMPLIEHVWRNASRAATLSRLVLAVDHSRVADAAHRFGAQTVMTRPDHPNGTSRLAEAAGLLGLADDTLVVNVQGDEPDLDPAVIDAAVSMAGEAGADITTVASPFEPGADAADPNVVKVVLRADGRALYFSRSLIPYPRMAVPGAGPLKHIGLYVYRVEFLRRYVALPPTPLEQSESLEQLRALEHGYGIAVVVRAVISHGIDTPEQYRSFVSRWRASNPPVGG